MEIVLVRHGRPARLARAMVSGCELGEWGARFNETGLSESVRPPLAVQELVKSVNCVVASDLARSIESARLLTSTDVTIDPELREAALPSSMGVSLRLPAGVWVVVARIAWWLNCRQSDEPVEATRARAARAADRLCALATRYQTIAVIGHGVFNRFIAKQLLIRGWKGPRLLSSAYWAVSRFTRTEEPVS